MATLLVNNITASPISITNFNIHNPNGVDAALLKNLLEVNFNNIVCQNKMEWKFITDMTPLDENNLIESLVVHSYDADLLETHSQRSQN